MKFVKVIKSELFVAYHGSNKLFSEFSLNFIKENLLYGFGIYLTENLHEAKKYGRYVYKCKVDINNPAIYMERWATNIDEKVDKLKSEGYDSIAITNRDLSDNKGNLYIAFYPSQVKIEQIIEYGKNGKKLNVFRPEDIK